MGDASGVIRILAAVLIIAVPAVPAFGADKEPICDWESGLDPNLFDDPDWVFEVKFDGFRALA